MNMRREKPLVIEVYSLAGVTPVGGTYLIWVPGCFLKVPATGFRGMTLFGVCESRIAPWLLDRLKEATGLCGELGLNTWAVLWLCDRPGFLYGTLGLASGGASGGLLDSGPDAVREVARRCEGVASPAFEDLDPGIGACSRGCS